MPRKKHIINLSKIAQAIQEYKTSTLTQKQCADKYGISHSVFSYYFLHGFKKDKKLDDTISETPFTKKQPKNNYVIELQYETQKPEIPQNIKETFNNAKKTTKTGKIHIDLDPIIASLK